MSMANEPGRVAILVVEDDERFLEDVVRPVFIPDWDVIAAHHLGEALAAIESSVVHAGLFDLDIPGGGGPGAGFVAAEALRAKRPSAALAILSGHVLRPLMNRAHALGIAYLTKDDPVANLALFSRQARALADERSRLAGVLAEHAEAHGLTAREAEIVALITSDAPRATLALTLGVSEATVKAHIRAVLAKCGETRIEDLGRALRRRAASARSS